ncbi:MAG: PrgI family protein [Candidatus Saccharimonadales bacterium]
MASYKVIQDIEAEDKLLGPLSLRQFIYAVIVVVLGFIMFRLALVQPLLAIPFLPPAMLFGVLAAPFGHDQSSEIWLLAKIRFFLKPRVRIWNQTGLQELVKITVPKKIDQILTDGLDQGQIKSRLQALAQTIDTRGWAVKGVDVNMYANPAYGNPSSDRLVSPSTLVPVAVPELDVKSADDILDTQNSAVAQQMNQLVQSNSQAHRQAIMDNMQQIRNTQQAPVLPSIAPVPASASTQPTLPSLPPRQSQYDAYGKTSILKPDLVTNSLPVSPVPPVPTPPKPDILELASNDDLSVATIARQANKVNSLGDDEVVISLR